MTPAADVADVRRRLHGGAAQVDRRLAGLERHEVPQRPGRGVVEAAGSPRHPTVTDAHRLELAPAVSESRQSRIAPRHGRRAHAARNRSSSRPAGRPRPGRAAQPADRAGRDRSTTTRRRHNALPAPRAQRHVRRLRGGARRARGRHALAFASGMAAIAAVVEGLPAGAVAVVPHAATPATVRSSPSRSALGRLRCAAVDITDTAAVPAALPTAPTCSGSRR